MQNVKGKITETAHIFHFAFTFYISLVDDFTQKAISIHDRIFRSVWYQF